MINLSICSHRAPAFCIASKIEDCSNYPRRSRWEKSVTRCPVTVAGAT